MKKRFKIEYLDPETQEWVEVEKEFDDSPEVSASMWAEDWAYSWADKGPHKVTPLD